MIPAKMLEALIREGDAMRRALPDSTHELGAHWEKAKNELFLSFQQEEPLLAKSIEQKLSAVRSRWENVQAQLLAAMVLPRYRVPMVLREKDAKLVLDHLYLWKVKSAHVVASECIGFPQEALELLATLRDQFGDCGWQEGEAFAPLREGVKEVARLLGYRYEKERDKFIPINPVTQQ